MTCVTNRANQSLHEVLVHAQTVLLLVVVVVVVHALYRKTQHLTLTLVFSLECIADKKGRSVRDFAISVFLNVCMRIVTANGCGLC